jgi:DNA-3-methyladenine glycosylase
VSATPGRSRTRGADTAPPPPDPDLFHQDVVRAARALIGVRLLVDGVGGVIVETEAYHYSEPASHAYRGPTDRNAVMFGTPGRAYVYQSYGLHFCLNFICGPEPGAGVLIRALAPTDGLDVMAIRRGRPDPRWLCSGPGKLCQALGVTRAVHNGLPLDRPPFALARALAPRDDEIVVGGRIGISKAVETPWRFGLKDSPFLSRRF